MKLWIDDCRAPPSGEWIVARNYHQAIRALSTLNIDTVSFDHDLGEELTGYDVVKMIEVWVNCCNYNPPQSMTVHSANPVGRAAIERAIEQIRKKLQ